jgi:hypothetical protein
MFLRHDNTFFLMEVNMRIPALFPESSRELIGNSLKRAKKSEFQRIQCIWLRITLGFAAEQIAEAIGWHMDMVW